MTMLNAFPSIHHQQSNLTTILLVDPISDFNNISNKNDTCFKASLFLLTFPLCLETVLYFMLLLWEPS